MAGVLKKSNQFFRNVFSELKKVKWPTRKELVSYTITVLVTVVILAIFFALVDLGVSKILDLITD
ncbi:protein translocase subunit SecE [Pullulanibacillus camelliae]|uniref:Protein translocase subunit SecE n=1 Tax=Pullulanibacillus camelliae TaxID=1707096 RepID=A0A8J3DZ22_9BACL|nr:preprotein translocase subunit SecE [Pullulanibacillus camelliae]GGE54252.1 protein translocase subunit SecE [Pullulanibacillus camelliae]